jgi:hypothetical protein
MKKMIENWTKVSVAAVCLAGTLGLGVSRAQAGNGHKMDFGISEGQVIPQEQFAIKAIMLGSAITEDGKDMPVTVSVKVHDQSIDPFGPSDSPLTGNVNDHLGVRSEIIHRGWEKHLPITVTATSWSLKRNADGTTDKDYSPHHNRNSNGDHPYVKVLRHGDPVPALAGFESQESIADFVVDYIDTQTNTIVLDENSAIFLFELGVTDIDSEAADFQDVVVLITLGESVAALQNGELLEALYD